MWVRLLLLLMVDGRTRQQRQREHCSRTSSTRSEKPFSIYGPSSPSRAVEYARWHQGSEISAVLMPTQVAEKSPFWPPAGAKSCLSTAKVPLLYRAPSSFVQTCCRRSLHVLQDKQPMNPQRAVAWACELQRFRSAAGLQAREAGRSRR